MKDPRYPDLIDTGWGPNWEAEDPELFDDGTYDGFKEIPAPKRVWVNDLDMSKVAKHITENHGPADQWKHGRRLGRLPNAGAFLRRLADPDGGFTLNLRTKSAPSTGYVVAKKGAELRNGKGKDIVANNTVSTEAQRILFEYINDHKSEWRNPKNHLGAWHSPDDGYIYYDVSVVVDDEESARRLAEQNEQDAYFDVENLKAVFLPEEVRPVRKGARGPKSSELILVRPNTADPMVTVREVFRAMFGDDVRFDPSPDTPAPRTRSVRRGNRIVKIVDGKPKGSRRFRK